jgi:multiple sugar transport system substrate-binding protein
MRTSRQHSGLPRFLRRLGLPQIVGLLTASLLVIALIFILSQPVTLTFVVPTPEAPAWKPLIEEFEANNPGIQIHIVDRADNQIEETYTSAFQEGNSSYDLIYMDIIWVPRFAQQDWLMDLSEQFPNNELDEFLLGDVNGGRYQGKLYRIPFRTDVGLLYYRKDLLKKAGYQQPPETFKTLIQISQDLQKQGEVPWGYLWQGQQSEGLAAMFVEVLQGYGGFWIKPKINDKGVEVGHEVGLDKPEAIEAVKFLLSTIEQKISPLEVTTYDEEATRRLFQNGAAVFLRNWPAVWSQANAADSSVHGKVAFTPIVHASGYSSGGCQGGWGLGIAKTTKHSEEAFKAIKFFTSATAQRKFVLEADLSLIPSRRNLFIDPQIVDRYSHYPKLLEVIDYSSVLRPSIPQYTEASSILQKYLSAALQGRQDPQAAMQAAARETRKKLGYQ